MSFNNEIISKHSHAVLLVFPHTSMHMDMISSKHHIHNINRNVIIQTPQCRKTLNPKAELFAALLRRLDTPNKVRVSLLVSVKVKNRSSNILFFRSEEHRVHFLEAVDGVSLFEIAEKLDMTVYFVADFL